MKYIEPSMIKNDIKIIDKFSNGIGDTEEYHI